MQSKSILNIGIFSVIMLFTNCTVQSQEIANKEEQIAGAMQAAPEDDLDDQHAASLVLAARYARHEACGKASGKRDPVQRLQAVCHVGPAAVSSYVLAAGPPELRAQILVG